MIRAVFRWSLRCGVLLTVAAAAGCGGPAAPAPTATPSASPSPTAAAVDACVVGAWKATQGTLPQQFNGGAVTVTGGGGAVITYHADGSYTGDFSNAQPYTATTPDGHQLSVTATGNTSGTVTASGGQLSLVSDQTTLTVTVRVDGVVTSTVHASRTSSAGYSCGSGNDLTLSSGGFSTHYTRVA